MSCLKNNKKQIIDWQDKDPHAKKELVFRCHKQIGDGIVLGADWNQHFYFSNLCVVLVSSNGENLFDILTAYPCPDLDETDKCWKARKEWTKRRQNSSRRSSY